MTKPTIDVEVCIKGDDKEWRVLVVEGTFESAHQFSNWKSALTYVSEVLSAHTDQAPMYSDEVVAREIYNGYCIKCKRAQAFAGEIQTDEVGRRMARGRCPACSTRLYRILGKVA